MSLTTSELYTTEVVRIIPTKGPLSNRAILSLTEMTASEYQQLQSEQSHTDTITRLGGWLFRRRTVIPIPLVLAVLLAPEPVNRSSVGIVAAGVVLVAAGELMRLWGVRHIGAISRTRSNRLGPLVASGPFALMRNPLYVGNVALWVGFALSARLFWLAPLFVAILGFEYHAIVRWEERLLVERLGDRYRLYASQVPRWVPNPISRRALDVSADPAVSEVNVFSWRDTFYSERGTLIAIGVGYVLLWIKAQV